jgi:hypothetical protein
VEGRPRWQKLSVKSAPAAPPARERFRSSLAPKRVIHGPKKQTTTDDTDKQNDSRSPCYGTATKSSSSFILVLVIENEKVEEENEKEHKQGGARE